ncbi:MAG: protein-glutamate O-methyltransferase CheR [Alphaproteobacteria bacterium]|nr:protein-glutamate O-methyltransferase CheR [Alphaproteobacteria bacterium]
MNPADIALLVELLKRRTGIALNPAKTHLIESRLTPVARQFGFRKADALLRDLLRHGREAMWRAATEALTTNDTWFFRDRAPFEQFRDAVLPVLALRRAATRKLRIWCCAVSTGQEVYSLAMLLQETPLLAEGWAIELNATDLNSQSIARAREGLYTSYEVQRGLGIRRLITYFNQEGDKWRIAGRLGRMIQFRTFNLLDDAGWVGTVDAVFCRNVLIYFEEPVKARVLDRLAGTLAEDGYLITGNAEMPDKVVPFFEALPGRRGLYAVTRPAFMLVSGTY